MKYENVVPVPPTLLDQYDFAYTGAYQSYTRTENSGMRWTFTFDKLRRLTQEKKEDTGQQPPALHYQKDFGYDKAGNRTGYQHQNGQGMGQYGPAFNYNSWSYDEMGRLTQLQDTNRSYIATVTNDWNGNITEVGEVIPGTLDVTSSFSYDDENRLTVLSIGGAGFSATHTYDGYNRLVKTGAMVGMNMTNYEHVYDGSRHLGSIDVTDEEEPVNGKVWKWGTGVSGKGETIEAPQFSSASANIYFQVNDEKNMSRRTYDANRNAGDTTEQTYYSEWMLVNGSAVGQRGAAGSRSELFSAYNTSLDADRSALPATDHALMLAQTDLEYEVTRVKSPVLGRDLNPMGRGDGAYYANGGNIMGGSVRIGSAKTRSVGQLTFGYGNGMNNQGLGGGGDDERLWEWMRRAQEECNVSVHTCPVLELKCGNPCGDLDLQDPYDFCCVCPPRICPSCEEGCSPYIGACCDYPDDWHEKCGNPAPGDGPPVMPPPCPGCGGSRGSLDRMIPVARWVPRKSAGLLVSDEPFMHSSAFVDVFGSALKRRKPSPQTDYYYVGWMLCGLNPCAPGYVRVELRRRYIVFCEYACRRTSSVPEEALVEGRIPCELLQELCLNTTMLKGIGEDVWKCVCGGIWGTYCSWSSQGLGPTVDEWKKELAACCLTETKKSGLKAAIKTVLQGAL